MNILQVKKYYLLIKKIIKQAKFTYSPFGKALKQQTKTIEDQGKKQIDALNTSKPKELETIKNNKSDNNEKSRNNQNE